MSLCPCVLLRAECSCRALVMGHLFGHGSWEDPGRVGGGGDKSPMQNAATNWSRKCCRNITGSDLCGGDGRGGKRQRGARAGGKAGVSGQWCEHKETGMEGQASELGNKCSRGISHA